MGAIEILVTIYGLALLVAVVVEAKPWRWVKSIRAELKQRRAMLGEPGEM